MEYDRRALAQAVLDAAPGNTEGHNIFYGAWSDDFQAYRERLRDALLKAFGIDLEAPDVLNMLLRSTLRGYAAIKNPWNYGEASLLFKRLEGSTVPDRMGEIGALHTQAKQVYLDMVDEVLGLMGPSVELVTSADLKAIGFDETPPSQHDYEMDY